MAKYCKHCGVKYRGFWGPGAAGPGSCEEYCSGECRRVALARRNESKAHQRQIQAVEESQKKLAKAKEFKILRKGKDYEEFWGDCLQCGTRVVDSNYLNMCQSCGGHTRFQLRLYGDGKKRMPLVCDHCQTPDWLLSVKCGCGGKVGIPRIQIARDGFAKYPLVGGTERDISADDAVIDVETKISGGCLYPAVMFLIWVLAAGGIMSCVKGFLGVNDGVAFLVGVGTCVGFHFLMKKWIEDRWMRFWLLLGFTIFLVIISPTPTPDETESSGGNLPSEVEQ